MKELLRKNIQMKIMRKTLLFFVIFLLSIAVITAQENHENQIEEGKALVESKISCDALTNEQLEAIGDYYMEQMHPGEAHELMDNMMGGEGSASLKQVHINMAKRLYCNEDLYLGYGMMNFGGMMGGGMMIPLSYKSNNSYWNFWIGLLLAAVILLLIWFVYTFATKRKVPVDTPMRILQKRFAKGEITRKQYEEMKNNLEE